MTKWRCPCGAFVPETFDVCYVCGAEHDDEDDLGTPKVDERSWLCACGACVIGDVCFVCRADRKTQPHAQPPEPPKPLPPTKFSISKNTQGITCVFLGETGRCARCNGHTSENIIEIHSWQSRKKHKDLINITSNRAGEFTTTVRTYKTYNTFEGLVHVEARLCNQCNSLVPPLAGLVVILAGTIGAVLLWRTEWFWPVVVSTLIITYPIFFLLDRIVRSASGNSKPLGILFVTRESSQILAEHGLRITAWKNGPPPPMRDAAH